MIHSASSFLDQQSISLKTLTPSVASLALPFLLVPMLSSLIYLATNPPPVRRD